MNLLNQHPHRRLNPLTGDWVLVSPHRTKRPWQGQVEKPPEPAHIAYDPTCYLCPGNPRAGGHLNPNYGSTFVFENDFAALYPGLPEAAINDEDLLVAHSERGISKVICFSPDHSLTLSRMTVDAIARVVDVWTEQFVEISSLPFIGTVIPFENRGAMMGSSNPHPHGQIWASETVPNEMVLEEVRQRAYYEAHGRTLLSRYLEIELEREERVICTNDAFVALVPFWAMWPFEVMVVSRRSVSAMDEMVTEERKLLADILRRVTARFDHLFDAPFPYTMGFHQRPTDGAPYPHFHFHAHYYPPLLRSATVRKFVAGFELLGTPQRDITAEDAAARLRAASEIF